jgi:glyoxylase-like metal-dependent hydrolase (beta-lactamase superfamily II)
MVDAADTWRVGDVAITRVVDLEVPGCPPEVVFSGLTEEQVRAVGWLQPHYVTPEGALILSVHAYVIESKGVRIIVDTCVGNDKPRLGPFFNMLSTPFLKRLAAAGFKPEDIDYVLCTHMHIDHVGWNTHWTGEAWIPTFPKARYLFGRVEWAHWQSEIALAPTSEEAAELHAIMEDSVRPIISAGLHDLIETDHRITDEVRLMHTPGHTPGHVSVVIASRGQTAVIAGDVMHHPIQLADAGLQANFDTDKTEAEATRRAFIRDHADRDILVLGTHFASPSAGWIVRDGAAWRFASSQPPAQ